MQFKGVGVALVTPFTREGAVDETALRKLVDHQVDNGTDFLVVQGTTGETATLTKEEKDQVLEIVIDQNNGRLPIVLGIADNNTAALVEEIKAFNNDKVDGYLSASPHYNKPSQKGIIAHFKAIAEVSTKPIILYNVPGRTGSNMTAETTLELAKVENIVAVKEASGDVDQVMQILKNAPADFAVLSGEDALTMPFTAMGGNGVISVVANALPQQFSEMMKATLEGDLVNAQKIHFQLLDITNAFFAEGNPSGIKYCLELLEIGTDTVRLPLTTISTTLKEKIKSQLSEID
ncbi:4-hydroxy-tetrahydrodipicolinate synthase [Brumimicrobium aurantiacum]|uniref:4-hydroxy-tetrahydrodipicolinate synthase n=1 Tax=Brumimicrobium aurantiacum TaxID=1737063 RepID=A0A3E1EUJ1_9FLAO|nr:4-hydroxy-tetrahydrodipicolinate synthase [Brumimicrobium aurantiacum]RFC53215.1 4-hydroxy-tetrahydrodipicolinate synthase [Brumimicrobium aurantiacum]